MYYDPEDRRRLLELAKQGPVKEFETRFKRKDGTFFWASLATVIQTTASGEPQLISSLQDITQRKQAEEEIKLKAQLLDAATDAIFLRDFDTGPNAKFIYANEAACKSHGYTKEEFMSMCMKDLAGNTSEMSATRRRQLQEKEDATYEEIHHCKDGTIIPVERHSSIVRLGGKRYILTVARDITQRKRAEEELQLKAQLLDGVIDSIFLRDFDGGANAKFLYVNEAASKSRGYTRDELMNMSMRDLNVLSSAEMTETRRKTLEEKSENFFETHHLRKDGTMMPVEVHASAVKLGDQKYILSVIRDITERKKAEEKLKQAIAELERSNAELQRFAYVASHDLQEPLRMVASYVQLLERRYKDKLDADGHDFINFAVDGTKRMQNLINDLLAYSRVGSRAQSFDPTNMERVFETTMANLQVAIKESKAKVTHEPLPTVIADEGQLVQVLQNLLSNAIKFHGKKSPHIHVSAEQKSDEWIFSVRDNGIGIDPQYFERIFIIFQRLHGQEYPGTGIGLPMVKRIVERHGGRIWIESEPGKGSTFYFSIPVKGVKQV